MYIQRKVKAHACHHFGSGTAIEEGRGLSDGSGNSEYRSLGDILATVLQGRYYVLLPQKTLL